MKKQTTQAIKDAYIRLYQTKPGEKINMSDVARECQISRSTLYSYYESLEDIEDDIALDFLKVLEEKFPFVYNLTWHGENVLEPVVDYLNYCKKNYARARIALHHEWIAKEAFPYSAEVIIRELHRRHPEKDSSTYEDLCQFYMQGAYSHFIQWIDSGCEEPVEELARRYTQALDTFTGQ